MAAVSEIESSSPTTPAQPATTITRAVATEIRGDTSEDIKVSPLPVESMAQVSSLVLGPPHPSGLPVATFTLALWRVNGVVDGGQSDGDQVTDDINVVMEEAVTDEDELSVVHSLPPGPIGRDPHPDLDFSIRRVLDDLGEHPSERSKLQDAGLVAAVSKRPVKSAGSVTGISTQSAPSEDCQYRGLSNSAASQSQ